MRYPFKVVIKKGSVEKSWFLSEAEGFQLREFLSRIKSSSGDGSQR
jgi:hypothetical protein